MGEDTLTGEKMATEGDEHIADAVTADLLCITVAVGRGSAATAAGPALPPPPDTPCHRSSPTRA
jgi:hypothetical protein